MKDCPLCRKKMERTSRPCPDGREGCAVYHFRYICKPCIRTEKEKKMNLEQLRYDIDEELRKEEYEEAKATAIANGIKKFWRKTKWRQFIQGIKCSFGRHLYNRIPSAGITTCPSCSRLWNTPYKGLRTVVNRCTKGYDDYDKLKGDK